MGCSGSAPSSPFAGTWKVVALPAGKDITLWLVRIDNQSDGLHGTVLSSGRPEFDGATVEEVRADGDTLHLRVDKGESHLDFVFHRSAGDATPNQLLGSTILRSERDFARLERTDQKNLDKKDSIIVNDPDRKLDEALSTEPGPAKEAALRKVIQEQGGRSDEYVARVELIGVLASAGSEDEVRAEADRIVAVADPYGLEMRRQALRYIGMKVLDSGKLSGVALDYARRAEQTLDSSTSAEERLAVLQVLGQALRSAGKSEEAVEVTRRATEAEAELIGSIEKASLPFEPDRFPGRRTKRERVALVELFTGANCPPCVAADLAFDGLLRTFTPRDVVLVQYHLNIPSFDPLSNGDTQRRARYYGISSTPQMRINGLDGPASGGHREHAEGVYRELFASLGEALESDAVGSLTVSVKRHDQRIDITAEAKGLTRKTARLRLLLVEDVVRYTGSNGQRLHHHVVRALPGGADGVMATPPAVRRQVTVDVTELRQSLRDEMTGMRAELVKQLPFDLRRLKVVALLQDDASKEVLQAAQIDVPNE
jgi:hypothetical protein